MSQQQRIVAAFAELKKRLAPAVLRENESNAIFIRNYIQKRGLDLGNADHLQQAVGYLDEKELIEWDVAPRELTAAEIKAKQRADGEAILRKQIEKAHQDSIENRKPFGHDAKAKEAENKDAAALKQIAQFISSYSVNGGPGRQDSVKTEAGRNYLANLKINDKGVFSPKMTLRCVGAAFHCESVADMKRVVQRELDAINGTGQERISIIGNTRRYNY